jgi:hypothetical protein
MLQQQETVYAKGAFVKNRNTKIGDIMSLDLAWNSFKEWGDANVNEKGYLKLDIMPKKGGADDRGNTHNVKLNTFVPDASRRQAVAYEETDSSLPF